MHLRFLDSKILVAALALLFAHPTAALADDLVVPTISLEEVRAKHQLPNSRYVDIDGINVHYVDEGSGPTVVLLHASYHSLRTWDGVAKDLARDHRVVRLDFPGAGLTGFETKPVPDGGYLLTDRNIVVLGKLVDLLGLDSFSLVGTSSGGTVAFHYAANNTDRVDRLVLINSAGMPRTAQTDPLRERPEFARWSRMPVRPRDFWEAGIGNNFFKPAMPPEWLVTQAYDFGRKEGLVEFARTHPYRTGDPKTELAKIDAPTLIMWGMSNPTVMHLEADVFEHWITGAPSMVIKYPGLGHYPYIEDEAAVLPDLRAFLGGELDGKLRQTMRVKLVNSPVE